MKFEKNNTAGTPVYCQGVTLFILIIIDDNHFDKCKTHSLTNCHYYC